VLLHLTHHVLARILGQMSSKFRVGPHLAVEVRKLQPHGKSAKAAQNRGRHQEEALVAKVEKRKHGVLAGHAHHERGHDVQGVVDPVHRVLLVHHGHVNVEEVPARPEVGKDGDHRPKAKPGEIVLRKEWERERG